MNKTKLYIISTYFPPLISIASNRILAFAQYIDKSIYDIEVITTEFDNPTESKIEIENVKITRFQNTGLLKLQKFTGYESYIVHKLKAAYNKFFGFLFRNENINWQKNVEKYLMQKLRNNSKIIILSSYAPVSPHLIALKLKNKGLAFYWIADFRDNMVHPHYNKKLKTYYTNLQNEIVNSANMILSVSKPIIEFLSLQNNNFKTQFLEIRNGYDFEIDHESTNFNEIFTIAYVGSFYGERKPHHFYEALKIFVNSNPDVKIEVHFIGVGHSIQIPDFAKKYIHSTPKVDHIQALKSMKTADALLLIHPNQNQKGVFSGKIFEYLACLKPIIATVDKNDVAAQLIRDCNAGFIADFDDVVNINNCIQEAYNLWYHKETLKFNIELITKHHRKVQVAILNKELKNQINFRDEQ